MSQTIVSQPNEAVVPKPTATGPDPRGWLRATLPVAFIAAFAELGLAIINNSALPIYFTHGLGLDTVVYTNIAIPFFLSEVLFKSPLGVIADRWGRKPLMVMGPAISIFTPLVLIAVHYPAHTIFVPLLVLFGFLRLLDGLGAAALWPAMFAYIGDHVHETKRSSAMGLLNVMYMMGLAFGFLAGGWANDTFGPVLSGEASLESAVQKVYDATRHNIRRHMNSFHQNMRDMHAHGIHLHLHALRIEATAAGLPINIDRPAQFHPSFYLGSILFALATIIALLALKDRKADEREGFEHHEADCGHGEPMTWAAFVEAVKSVPHLMLIAFVAFFGIGCIALLVKVFALDELGISETEFGLLVLWPAVVIGALAIPLGQISDKFGQVRSVRVGFLVAASGMWAIIFLFPIHAVQDIALMAGGTLLGLGFVISFPAWMALLTTIGGEERRGTVIGAVSTAQGVGMLCGAELGGILYRRASADPHIAHLAPFAASAVFLTAAALMTFFMISSHTKDAKPVDA